MANEAVSPFDNPLGRAFAKVVEDEAFADQVRQDPRAALARFELADSEFEAVAADAHAIDVGVEGFAFPRVGHRSFATLMGGLRTPSLLGINALTYSWTASFTLT